MTDLYDLSPDDAVASALRTARALSRRHPAEIHNPGRLDRKMTHRENAASFGARLAAREVS
jgi:hypothetical protein